MSKEDWYRNERWDADIEATFRKRLARSRSQRPQYLKLQAGHLAKDYPETALLLVEEYFATGDSFFTSDAYGIRATALKSLGKIGGAVEALKLALAWEAEHPGFTTTARLDFPRLVAENRLRGEFVEALAVLTERFKPSDLVFPLSRYVWNGCHALILEEQGNIADARYFAERALAAAMATEPPFRYHRSLGIVESTDDEFGLRIKRIASPSKLRAFIKLIKSR